MPQTAEGLSKCLLEEDSFGTWGSEYDTHVTAVHFMTAAFLPLLAAATDHGFPEPGNIVNIASLSGITRTSQRGQFNYNASKAATIHLSLMHATEFARRGLGIRVNAISPGYFPSVSLHGRVLTDRGRACQWPILETVRVTTSTGARSMVSLLSVSATQSIMLSASLPLLW